MAENIETQEEACLICNEAAVDVRFEDGSFLVDCLDCGPYEILPLAAKHIQEHAVEIRQHLLQRARRLAEAPGGRPLIREPFDLP